MEIAALHAPLVRQAIASINAGRLDDFLALFAPDATLEDEATYVGIDAIRAWARRETFGVRMHIDVVREITADGTTVEFQATSTGGYAGPGTFAFTLREDHIERLEIG